MNNNNEHLKYFSFTLKHFLVLFLVFVITYFEPLMFFGIKISQIWKGFVVLWFLLVSLHRGIYWWILIGFLFAIKYLFYSYFPYGFNLAVSSCLEGLFLPTFLSFLYQKYKNNTNYSSVLLNYALIASIFVIYSTVPFMIGLDGFNQQTDLTRYGLEGYAIKGIFYSIASSSKMFSIATLFLLVNYKMFLNSKMKKFFFYFTIGIGMYMVYGSFTRTGWIIFIFGLFFINLVNSTKKQKILGVLYIIIFFNLFAYLYEFNSGFRMRLTGGATYRQYTELSVETLAESRLPFILIAINNLLTSNFEDIIIGYGAQRGIDLFEIKTGMAIVSHNGTFEILESSGIAGLILYFIFIYNLFKKSKIAITYENNDLRRNWYLALYLFISFFLTSHGTPIYGEFIYGCIFVIGLIQNYQKMK
jgi:hypothetical protein